MVENTLFNRYRIALAGLCSCCAQIATIKADAVKGLPIDESQMEYLCKRLVYCRQEVLFLKSELGYSDELAFMADNNFKGFSIKDGALVGDPKDVFLIIRPWYENFPNEGNNYTFEVANYLLAFMAEMNKRKDEPQHTPDESKTRSPLQKHLRLFARKCKNFLLY